jgi:hypothetical protein
VPDVNEVPLVLDLKRSDPRDHTSVEFELTQVADKHFRSRDDRLPVKLINLGDTEELIAAKGKRRPAVVLFEVYACDLSGIAQPAKRIAKALEKNSFVLAPMYSCATAMDPGTFMPEVVARIRALRYPHLACLPRLGVNTPEPGEIIRLDRLCVAHLSRGTTPSGHRLHKEVFQLVIDQLIWCASSNQTDYLRTVVETVYDTLPAAATTPAAGTPS